MHTITITKNEFMELRRIQDKRRRDWHAVFSINCHGNIWTFETFARTPLNLRKEVSGVSRILDDLAQEYGRIRLDRGRVFIDKRGAFYKVGSNEIQFARFEFSD